MKEEINFPALHYNIAQAYFSLCLFQKSFIFINKAIDKEFELIKLHIKGEKIVFNLWILLHKFKSNLEEQLQMHSEAIQTCQIGIDVVWKFSFKEDVSELQNKLRKLLKTEGEYQISPPLK